MVTPHVHDTTPACVWRGPWALLLAGYGIIPLPAAGPMEAAALELALAMWVAHISNERWNWITIVGCRVDGDLV